MTTPDALDAAFRAGAAAERKQALAMIRNTVAYCTRTAEIPEAPEDYNPQAAATLWARACELLSMALKIQDAELPERPQEASE